MIIKYAKQIYELTKQYMRLAPLLVKWKTSLWRRSGTFEFRIYRYKPKQITEKGNTD